MSPTTLTTWMGHCAEILVKRTKFRMNFARNGSWRGWFSKWQRFTFLPGNTLTYDELPVLPTLRSQTVDWIWNENTRILVTYHLVMICMLKLPYKSTGRWNPLSERYVQTNLAIVSTFGFTVTVTGIGREVDMCVNKPQLSLFNALTIWWTGVLQCQHQCSNRFDKHLLFCELQMIGYSDETGRWHLEWKRLYWPCWTSEGQNPIVGFWLRKLSKIYFIYSLNKLHWNPKSSP